MTAPPKLRTSVRVVFPNVEFAGNDIKEASVVEEFSPLSIVVPVSTLDLQLHSSDVSFSIVNPSGNYQQLLQHQPMSVYETVNGQERFIGVYYLENWNSPSENIKSFSCIDIMGLLDKYDYMGGLWLTPTAVSTIVADILGNAGVEFDIDPIVAAKTLVGWIPICSYREALQQVLFAASAYVLVARQQVILIGQIGQSTSNSLGLRSGVGATGQSRHWQFKWRPRQEFIYAPGDDITRGVRSGANTGGGTPYVITTNANRRLWQKRFRQSQWVGLRPTFSISLTEQSNLKLNLKPVVTGVELTVHTIVSSTNTNELFKGTLAVGNHEIRFGQPMHDLTITGGTILESYPNYCVISVSSPGTVTISGQVYIDVQSTFSRYSSLYGSPIDNVVRISNATMVDRTNAQSVVDTLYNYYQQRYAQSVKLFSPLAQIGDVVNAETLYSNNLYGVIEKMTTNLKGGNVANTEIVGTITT